MMEPVTALDDALEFACYSRECIPPIGGSSPKYPGGGQSITEILDTEGGFTIAADGSTPKVGISVGAYPERTVVVKPGQDVEKAYTKFRKDNADLLAEPGNHAGGWKDEHGDVWLDVSKVFPPSEREAAIKLGRELNQIEIWDIEAGEGIPTGGTGKA